MYRTLKTLVVVVLILGLVAGGYWTRQHWLAWLSGRGDKAEAIPADASLGQAAGQNQQVLLSPQAQKNLKLSSKPLLVTTYNRTIQIPGTVVDRPGVSDRGVVSPATGVVAAIHQQAGDVVRPGEPLFNVRLVGEALQASQTELFKAAKDREITQGELDRLETLVASGGIPRARVLELQNDLRRTEVRVQAHRQDLALRGLTIPQIDAVEGGEFMSEIVVSVPTAVPPELADPAARSSDGAVELNNPVASAPSVLEVQELAVRLGDQVQAGQSLCTLSDHRSLMIEGRAFRQEISLLQAAAEASSPIEIELLEENQQGWTEAIEPALIHHLSNTLNDDNRTVSFYLPLVNQSRTYQRGEDTLMLWRFRPGQRLRLHLQVETLGNVFVLPADAVVKEGPEYYVFRRNGDLFDRKPVHVLHRTQNEVVIANDGGLPPGIYVAQTGAVQLNRVLKSQGDSAPAGVHVHADGSVHSNH